MKFKDKILADISLNAHSKTTKSLLSYEGKVLIDGKFKKYLGKIYYKSFYCHYKLLNHIQIQGVYSMGKIILNSKLAADATTIVSALVARSSRPSIVLSGDSKVLAINGLAKVMLEGLGMESDEVAGLIAAERSFGDSLATPQDKISIVRLYTQAAKLRKQVLEAKGEKARSVDVAEAKSSDDAESMPKRKVKTANSDMLTLSFKCDAAREVSARVRLKIDMPSSLSERGVYVLEFAKGK